MRSSETAVRLLLVIGSVFKKKTAEARWVMCYLQNAFHFQGEMVCLRVPATAVCHALRAERYKPDWFYVQPFASERPRNRFLLKNIIPSKTRRKCFPPVMKRRHRRWIESPLLTGSALVYVWWQPSWISRGVVLKFHGLWIFMEKLSRCGNLQKPRASSLGAVGLSGVCFESRISVTARERWSFEPLFVTSNLLSAQRRARGGHWGALDQITWLVLMNTSVRKV